MSGFSYAFAILSPTPKRRNTQTHQIGKSTSYATDIPSPKLPIKTSMPRSLSWILQRKPIQDGPQRPATRYTLQPTACQKEHSSSLPLPYVLSTSLPRLVQIYSTWLSIRLHLMHLCLPLPTIRRIRRATRHNHSLTSPSDIESFFCARSMPYPHHVLVTV